MDRESEDEALWMGECPVCGGFIHVECGTELLVCEDCTWERYATEVGATVEDFTSE